MRLVVTFFTMVQCLTSCCLLVVLWVFMQPSICIPVKGHIIKCLNGFILRVLINTSILFIFSIWHADYLICVHDINTGYLLEGVDIFQCKIFFNVCSIFYSHPLFPELLEFLPHEPLYFHCIFGNRKIVDHLSVGLLHSLLYLCIYSPNLYIFCLHFLLLPNKQLHCALSYCIYCSYP